MLDESRLLNDGVKRWEKPDVRKLSSFYACCFVRIKRLKKNFTCFHLMDTLLFIHFLGKNSNRFYCIRAKSVTGFLDLENKAAAYLKRRVQFPGKLIFKHVVAVHGSRRSVWYGRRQNWPLPRSHLSSSNITTDVLKRWIAQCHVWILSMFYLKKWHDVPNSHLNSSSWCILRLCSHRWKMLKLLGILSCAFSMASTALFSSYSACCVTHCT